MFLLSRLYWSFSSRLPRLHLFPPFFSTSQVGGATLTCLSDLSLLLLFLLSCVSLFVSLHQCLTDRWHFPTLHPSSSLSLHSTNTTFLYPLSLPPFFSPFLSPPSFSLICSLFAFSLIFSFFLPPSFPLSLTSFSPSFLPHSFLSPAFLPPSSLFPLHL